MSSVWSVLTIWQGAISKMEAYVEHAIDLLNYVPFGYKLTYNIIIP